MWTGELCANAMTVQAGCQTVSVHQLQCYTTVSQCHCLLCGDCIYLYWVAVWHIDIGDSDSSNADSNHVHIELEHTGHHCHMYLH